MSVEVNLTPSDELLKAVRVRLLMKDASLSSYCSQKGFVRQNVTAALIGQWKGPKASRLVHTILADLGLAD